jgi:hypothetical protein
MINKNTEVYDDELSSIKLWHSIKRRYMIKQTKINSLNIYNDLYGKSYQILNIYCSKQLKRCKSLNIKRPCFEEDYIVVT